MRYLLLPRVFAAGLLGFACLVAGGKSVFAQPTSEEGVKVGFLLNVMKFTHWPDEGEIGARPLRLCTLGAAPLEGKLDLIGGRSAQGRDIEIRKSVSSRGWRQCDVMYLGDGDGGEMEAVIRHLTDTPVLTVGDLPGFVQAGGMIGLRVEANRIRFDVNLAAAQRAGLKFNSQMLMLAGRVLK